MWPSVLDMSEMYRFPADSGTGFGVWDLGSGFWCLGFGVWDSGFGF